MITVAGQALTFAHWLTILLQFDFISDIHNNDARSNLEILNTILNGSSHDGGAPQIEQEEYHMQHRYEALCRGEYSRKNIKQRTSDSRYRCAYVRNDPLLVLRPVKYERISIDPEIFLYYEIVSNREVQILKGLAFPYVSTLWCLIDVPPAN